ncbi:MAG: MFS transporter [Lachnospiraceae bacterium]
METKYTLDDAPFCGFHAKIIAYTFGGSFVDGYILGIIEFAIISVSAYMNMSSVWQGLITSSPLIGVLIGSLIFGDLSDKIGRQKIYTINFFVILIVSVLQFFVNGPALLFVLRLILGICIGAEYAIGPAIVGEFVPTRLRAKMLTVLCAAWTVGYVVAAYAGAWMQTFGDEGWRWMLSSSAVIALIVLLIRLGMPETPRWLIAHGRIDEARAVVKKHFGENVTIEPIIKEVLNQKKEKPANRGFKDLFKGDQLKKTVFCAVSWGANILPTCAILSFVPMILEAMGIKDENTFYTLILNGMFLLAAIIVLVVVDKFSRRKMLLGGMIVSGVPLLILGFWAGAPIWLITACFTIHLIGNQCYGTVAAYIYPVESFPTELRTTGAGFCSAASRIFSATGTFIFPVLMERLGVYPLLVGIAAIIAVAFVMAVAWAPETSEISVDEA